MVEKKKIRTEALADQVAASKGYSRRPIRPKEKEETEELILSMELCCVIFHPMGHLVRTRSNESVFPLIWASPEERIVVLVLPESLVLYSIVLIHPSLHGIVPSATVPANQCMLSSYKQTHECNLRLPVEQIMPAVP